MVRAARTVAPLSSPQRRLLLVTDRGDESLDLQRTLERAGDVIVLSTEQLSDMPPPHLCGIVVDINLRCSQSVQFIRRRLIGRGFEAIPRLFVLGHELHHGSMQAWALGATDTMTRPFDPSDLLTRIGAAFPELSQPQETTATEAMASGISAAQGVLTKIFERLPAGQTLSYRDVVKAEGPILKAIKRTSLRDWLTAVGRHHKESFRLTLFVTGYAVAFAQHLGMREEDQRRLTRAALLSDVGKAFVESRLLDGCDTLQDDDLRNFQDHPRLGYEALVAEGSFPRETLDVVLHHHEWLDGSGYPDRLQGDQISDIVRVTTIFDVFASLVAPRTNCRPLTPLEAFCRMEQMADKIDQRLLQAFRPVALSG